jgi:hypothetical protein
LNTSVSPPLLLTALYIVLLAGCAQIVKPTGGPKDIIPPKPISYTPADKSVNFNSKTIYIVFDEYIQLKNISDQLIVSPPLKRRPEIKLKGKGIEIILHDTLLKNTTYTFNFGNSISDLHEGNILKNFQYVFSTGDYLDSITLKGNVRDAYTGEPVKQASVLLYFSSAFSDSTIYKKNPSYCGLTDDNGNYKIEHLKPEEYNLVSMYKCASDYLYHPGTQTIGFSGNPLKLESNDSANLYMFKEENLKLHLMKARGIEQGRVMIVFSKHTDSLTIRQMKREANEDEQTLLQYSVTGDTVTYWLSQVHAGVRSAQVLDSLRFIVLRKDSVLDTGVVYSFPAVPKPDKKKPPPSLKISTNISEREPFDFHQKILLQFSHPIAGYDRTKLFLLMRKDTLAYSFDTSNYPYSLLLSPAKALEPDSLYRLALYPGAFKDIFGLTNDTLILKFSIQEPTYYGTLSFSVKINPSERVIRAGQQGNYLLQMLDANNNVFRQNKTTGTGTFFFDALPPGNYRFRIIDDRNNNGRWDAGNYLNGIEPERIYYYKDGVQIRSNWDLTQSWKLNVE